MYAVRHVQHKQKRKLNKSNWEKIWHWILPDRDQSFWCSTYGKTSTRALRYIFLSFLGFCYSILLCLFIWLKLMMIFLFFIMFNTTLKDFTKRKETLSIWYSVAIGESNLNAFDVENNCLRFPWDKLFWDFVHFAHHPLS